VGTYRGVMTIFAWLVRIDKAFGHSAQQQLKAASSGDTEVTRCVRRQNAICCLT
jgi:hypothetical protein